MADGAGKSGFEAIYGLLAVIGALCVIIVILLWSVLQEGGAARLLAIEGREAVAEVRDLRREETRRVDDQGRVRLDVEHFVTVRFDTPAARGVEVEAMVEAERYAALRRGDRIEIRYAASDPGVIEFQAGDRAGEAAFLRWVAFGLAVVAAGLGVLAVRQYPGRA